MKMTIADLTARGPQVRGRWFVRGGMAHYEGDLKADTWAAELMYLRGAAREPTEERWPPEEAFVSAADGPEWMASIYWSYARASRIEVSITDDEGGRLIPVWFRGAWKFLSESEYAEEQGRGNIQGHRFIE